MPMSAAFRAACATHGGSLVATLGLVDDQGRELTGGTPAYRRRAVAWQAVTDGTLRPVRDLVFDVPADATVAGWRAYSRSGEDYGGADLSLEFFRGQGEYVLRAAGTGITVTDGSGA